MLKIVNKLPPTEYIARKELDGREIIGMKCIQGEARGLKYVLTPRIRGEVAFSRGSASWGIYTSMKEAIDVCMQDNRCELFAFLDVDSLSKWLASND